MCEAPRYQGLVEFYGAFFTPDSGQISIALEYMDGGSLADILRVRKVIPEPVLSCMAQRLLDVRERDKDKNNQTIVFEQSTKHHFHFRGCVTYMM